MHWQTARVSYANPLVNQYLNDFPAVAGHFTYNYADPAAFIERRREVLGRYRTDRRKLAAVLREFNLQAGCGPAALDHIDLLEKDDTTVILTGQQPGIFTGPLYTVYKALSAVKLSQRLKEQGINAVPLFWVGGEDHDFYEVSHIHTLTPGGLEKLALAPLGDKKASVGGIPVTRELYSLIDVFGEVTPPGSFKEETKEWLRQTAGAGAKARTRVEAGDTGPEETEPGSRVTLGLWFARLMAGLFRDYGLVLANPLDPFLKALGLPKMAEFVTNNGEVQQAFAAGEERVREAGFKPQVPAREESLAHIFANVDGERRALFSQGNIFALRDNSKAWNAHELLREAEKDPVFLSPNVATKPVLQDYLFPILAYVAGPGETGYYAQFRELYNAFGGEMPVIFPRLNITVIEEHMARNMKKYNLSFTDVVEHWQEKLDSFVAATDPLCLTGRIEKYKEKFAREYGEIVAQAALLDPNMEKLGYENLHKITQQMDFLAKKTEQQLRKKNEVAVGHFEKLRLNLRPQNNWQERVFNVFQYYFKYGPALIDFLMTVSIETENAHHVLYMD